MNPDNIQHWLELYNLETYLFEAVSNSFHQHQTLTEFDFYAIVIWKSNRSKTKIQHGFKKQNQTVGDLLKAVYQADTDEERITLLLDIPGIGLPIASAILAVCYSDRFTILDYRARDILQEDGKTFARNLYTPAGYLEYCATCRELAQQHDLSLRDLDRVLWTRSWEQDLLELINPA